MLVELETSVPIWTQCKVVSTGVPTAPTGNVTYRVLDEDGSLVGSQSGNMTSGVDSKTGLCLVKLTASAANGYARGKSYAVHINATVSSLAWSTIILFTVA